VIIFEFDYETHNSDETLKDRAVYWLSCTSCDGEDDLHSDEIHEQLAAETCGLTEEN
jgi:hypothetical protein